MINKISLDNDVRRIIDRVPPRSIPSSAITPADTDGKILVTDNRVAKWQDSGYIPESIGDAKGDLIGFSAADTPVKIAGTTTERLTLTTDTSEASGVRWGRNGRLEFGRKSTGNTNVTISATHTTLDSVTVAGDGIHGLMVFARYLYTVGVGGSAGGRIFDGVPTTTQLQDDVVQSPGGTQCSFIQVYIPPWTGNKAVYLAHASTTAAGTVYINTANPLHFWGIWSDDEWVQAGSL
jgi:hypothetical protein